MDTGKGKFEIAPDGDPKQAKKSLEEKYPNHGGWFRVGEIVIINGSRFRIKSVRPTELRLKLLPKE